MLSDERRSLVGGQSVMDIIFREIREFGESLILLDQHPSKISLSALGNTNCTIAMNLKDRSATSQGLSKLLWSDLLVRQKHRGFDPRLQIGRIEGGRSRSITSRSTHGKYIGKLIGLHKEIDIA